MNRQDIINAIICALEDNEVTYSDEQVEKLYYRWLDAKTTLIDLLRKHPNWSEDLCAVVFDQNYERCVDIDIVKQGLSQIKHKIVELERKTYVDVNIKAKIREYDDMVAEFGTDIYGMPRVTHGFNTRMQQCCGRDVVIKRIYIDGSIELDNDWPWTWHIQMIENRAKILQEFQNIGICDILSTLYKHTNSFSSKVNEETKSIFDKLGIPAVIGQKTSRVLGNWFRSVGIDKMIPDEFENGKTVHPYNRIYTQIADALNPLSIKRHTVLSVHPVDYLRMSNGHGWSSCHNIYDGCHASGTLSYMCDQSTMIFYTVDAKYDTSEIYNKPKINRQVYCLEGSTFLQSRLYPDDNLEYEYEQFRNTVQMIIAEAMGVPNYWSIKTKNILEYVETHPNSAHYPDYRNGFHAVLSTLKDVSPQTIHIGSSAYCIECGTEIGSGRLICDDCNNKRICDCCGNYYQNLNRAYNGNGSECFVCDDCLCEHYTYCDECNEHISDDCMDEYFINGSWVHICYDCYNEYYFQCDECGRVFRTNDMSETDGVCRDCYSEKYFVCENCGAIYDNDDMSEEDGVCCDCYDMRKEVSA